MKEKMEGEGVASPTGGVVGEGTQQIVRPATLPPDTMDDVNGNPTDPNTQQQTSKGGPRLITINRTDQGFGFTLRHFIVYPPELSELLGDHGEAPEPLSSLDPLDTIFVKHVRPGSSAHLAGLRTGDRVVSVNGQSVGSRTYQEVVATIQLSPPTLQLLVVPREQDLLQQVFGETAHNPESNLDVRMPSPSHLPPQHLIRHPAGPPLSQPPLGVPPHYPASLSSAWSSQSSLNSAMSTGAHPTPVIMAHPPFHQRPHQSPKVMQPHGAHIPIHPHQQSSATPIATTNQSATPYWAGPRKHSLSGGGEKQVTSSGSRKQSLPGSADRRQAVHTIQNTLSTVPLRVPSSAGKQSSLPPSTNTPGVQPNVSSNEPSNASVFGVYEPILDRAMGRGSFRDSRRLERDPDGRIYEVVQTRVIESKLNNANMQATRSSEATLKSHLGRKTSAGGEADAKRVRVQSLSPPRLKSDGSHPRSISVHTQPEHVEAGQGQEASLYGSQQSISSTKSEVLNHNTKKHNVYARRSMTEPLSGCLREAGHSNDKSTQEVINRIKKNVERKEEFLKRPNQPIWLPASKAPTIHTDYHVSPQKFQRPLWPPPAAQTPPSPGSITKALTCLVGNKQDKQAKSDDPSKGSDNLYGSPSGGQSDSDISKKPIEDAENQAPAQDVSLVPRSLVGNSVPKPYVGSSPETSQANSRYGKGFTSTLSRIQENIPIPEHGSTSSLASRSGGTNASTPTSSERSFSTGVLRPVPLAWVGDNERIKQLQIVSKRAKQFESSQLEKEASPKSAFHRFELSRLSQRTKIPNVAQRKQEFEKKDSDQNSPSFEFEFGTQYNNAPRQRKSAELVRSVVVSKELSPSPPKVFRSLSDGGTVFPVSRRLYAAGYDEGTPPPSGEEEETVRLCMNRVIPIGGPHIHCEPPPHMAGNRPQSDSDVLERERSNSVCSQASMSSLWSTQSMDESSTTRQKGVTRQNSYLSAVHSPLPYGELAKQRGEANAPAAPNENTTPTTTTSTTTTTTPPPPYPSPADGYVPRPKRPTFLPIKIHARPALNANDKQSPVGPGKGLEERSHASLPPARSTTQRTASCSSLGSLPHSMYQLPAVPTPTVPTSSAGTVAGITVVTSATTSTGATTTTTAASAATVSTSSARGPAAANDALVSRRNKALYGEEGERLVRRVSYLKATSGDRMYPDSDLDSDTDDRSGGRVGLVAEADGVESATPHTPGGPMLLSHPPSPESIQSDILRQGTLHVKLTLVDGKRAGDRSWKTVWAVVQGRAIIFYKDRQHVMQTPLGVEEQISLRGAEVEVATDYTKRRNVLRLATPGGSQLLLQADTPPDMLAWLSTLHNNCAIQEGEGESKAPMNNNISPQTGNKAMRKLTSLRTRSPTGQSPSIKTRKPGSVESNTSPKSKTWRGHLKRPFMKKVQSGSPAATPTMPVPEGATIGVCLEDCPQSHENEFVPLLVSLCVGVVESRGLQTQGIYRIPGNKASVTHLTEMINRDPKSIDYDDSRWGDVNVISSMLKQFFQKLPDPLFTSELYPLFIEASKVDDPKQRMLELKKLVHELPDHHYETLRFLIMHLNNIVTNSDTNKMDVRNLAIVFGPTLVRSGDDNMVTMVTDMSHQCRIVETLISYANWFFLEDEGEEFSPPVLEPAMTLSPAADSFPPPPDLETPSSQALLLHNIQKVEGNIKGDMKKDIVSSIISAANRKVHKGKQKKALEDKPVDESKFSDRDGGFEERDIDKEAELRKQRLMAKQMESMVELPDPKPMSERKISNMSLMSVQSHMSGGSNVSQHEGERTSGSGYKLGLPGDDPRLYSIMKKEELASPPIPLTLPSNVPTMAAAAASQQSSQFTPETSSLFGDEVAIRSYAGLSASTQERIRRFEMETRAMLHRDLTRHRRETERRDAERQRLEELWQRAKQDMESEDILDQLADNPTEVVRKISDYSWRLQGLSENVGGQRGSLASQGSTTSPQAVLSAALSHHPLSNTSFTPTTNATTQVPNNHLHPPTIKIVNEPMVGKPTDSNEYRHGMLQQNSLAWLDYNIASPHSTLGSTSSSSSSGYGSLTRPSHSTNRGETEDTTSVRAVDEAFSLEPSVAVPKPGSASQHSSPSNTKKKKSSKGPGFFFGLTSSSSSPSLFPSMAEAATELTPTRKIGQTTIYPESPRPPPSNKSHLSSQSQLTVPGSALTHQPNNPIQGRHKDSILHHILPSRLYHSPRPLRRGSSAENVTQPLINPTSPSTFDTQKVVNNGTLKRARTSREQILNGPEAAMPRCGSLDSLRDGPHVPHDDGSDLLSAITATFEEKMRSLQESPLGLVASDGSDSSSSSQDSSPEEPRHLPEQSTRGSSTCRLYRDPSLHRRRTSPRTSVTNPTIITAASATTTTNTTMPSYISQVDDSHASSIKESDNKILSEEVKPGVKVKRSDSLTKSEKTENNLKEKTEKRARELKRTDTQESLNEKRPKEMKRSDLLEGKDRLQETSKMSDMKENMSGPPRRSSDIRSRRHNVKELKEKFEQNTNNQANPSPMKPSNSLYGNSSSSINKGSKAAMRRTGYRGPIKRRHTVGGTKDLAKWAWLHSVEVSKNALRATRLTAWERLQPLVVDERLNTDRSLEAWLTHERIRTSSPDLSRPQQFVLPPHIVGDKENLHRRLSVQEAALNPLYPVLESHV